MKKTIALLLLILATTSVNAQNSSQILSWLNKNEKKITTINSSDSFGTIYAAYHPKIEFTEKK